MRISDWSSDVCSSDLVFDDQYPHNSPFAMVEAHQNWAFAARASSNGPSTRTVDDLPGPRIDVDKADPSIPDEFEPIGARGRIIGWTEIFASPHLRQHALFD